MTRAKKRKLLAVLPPHAPSWVLENSIKQVHNGKTRAALRGRFQRLDAAR